MAGKAVNFLAGAGDGDPTTILAMPRDDFRLRHELRVRWAEVDPQGIVFNPNYLMYFDVAAPAL